MKPLTRVGGSTLFLAVLALRAGAQTPATGTVQGTVYDSIRGRPLADATVQLVNAAETAGGRTHAARTDSAGRFRMAAVPPGSYLGGFFHPLLDSLGFEGEQRAVLVSAGVQRLDFALPSPATIVEAICPPAEGGDSTGLLIGHVRATDDERPIAGASVAVGWTELGQGALLVKPEERTGVAETTPEGWFALCGVPAEVPLLVRAAHGVDSSGYARLTVPARGFVHAPFFVGGVVAVAEARSDSSAGGGARASAPLLRGRAQLRGTAVDERGRPMREASVLVWGTGLDAQTNARGAFSLDSLPGGTHTLEVRAVGFAPVQRVVHLAERRPVEVTMQLGERAVALPTVAVRGRPSAQIRMTRFYERMRDSERGINRGYFVTPEDMERRKPAFVTQMLDGYPGITILKDPFDPGKTQVGGPLRTGISNQDQRCVMNIFVDGIRAVPRFGESAGMGAGGRFATDETIDKLVDPSTVAAIEIYPHPVSAPPQYQPLNGRCGVILIWTR